jgi:hypothetical protein
MTCSALVHSEPRSTRRQSEHVIKSVRDSACRHGRRSGIEQCIVELEEARVGAAHGPLAEHEVEEARLAFAHMAHGRDPRLHGRGCGARAPAGRVPARGAIRRIGLRQLRPSSCLIETTLRGAHLQPRQMEQPQCLQNRGRESAVTFKACGKGRHSRGAGDFGTTHDSDAVGPRRGREVLKRRERPCTTPGPPTH